MSMRIDVIRVRAGSRGPNKRLRFELGRLTGFKPVRAPAAPRRCLPTMRVRRRRRAQLARQGARRAPPDPERPSLFRRRGVAVR